MASLLVASKFNVNRVVLKKSRERFLSYPISPLRIKHLNFSKNETIFCCHIYLCHTAGGRLWNEEVKNNHFCHLKIISFSDEVLIPSRQKHLVSGVNLFDSRLVHAKSCAAKNTRMIIRNLKGA
jgi:hypothetical protein